MSEEAVNEFFALVELGDADRVRQRLAAQPELARSRDRHGATALHIAAFHGRRDLVSLLLAAGADVNARDDKFGATPSGWAIEYLRELGGLLAIEIEDVLHAIRTRDADWARRLVTRHPELVHASDAEGTTLAEHARASGVPEIITLFE